MAREVSTCAECIAAFDRVWDVDWSRNPLDWRNLLIAPRQIRDVVVREGYDIVHVHTPVAAFVTRYALRGLRKQGGIKVIYSAHGFSFYKGAPLLQNILFFGLEKLAGGWTDYLVVTNYEDTEVSKRSKLVPVEQVRYMPGIGVDVARFSPETVSETEVSRVRHEMNLVPEDQLFLMAAEFIPRKRHRDMLRAFARLDRSDVHLALPGAGPLLEKMKHLASDLGIQKRIHFLGFRRDLPSLMRASVATILPSEHEGLPRSVMESLCLEVPVIGTDIPGTRQLLRGGGGLLVEVGDIEGMARAMAWILDHPREARKMGQCGSECMTTYDVHHVLRLHEDLFAESLSAR